MYQCFEPHRSSEKYAPVFRYLHNHGVTPEDAAHFIETFDDKVHGGRLAGIERASRAEARQETEAAGFASQEKELTDEQRRVRQTYLDRSERRDNADVFELHCPDFKNEARYGEAVFKIEGESIVIVGFKKWEQQQFESYSIKRGKERLKQDNDERDRAAKTIYQPTRDQFERISHQLSQSKKFRELLLAGYSEDQALDLLLGVIDQAAIAMQGGESRAAL